MCRTLARLTEASGFARPIECLSGAAATSWYKHNKYPLLAIAPRAPAWLVRDPAFKRALAEEHDWYGTQRHEYALVRDAWLAEGIPCLMIKSAGKYPSFPHTSDNIDILVKPAHGRPARETLRRLGYVEVRNVEEPQKFLFRKFHDGRCVSAIHVHEQVAWFVGFMDEEALWQRRRPANDDPFVDVPSPEDAILINLAHACYENKLLRFNDVARIRHALRLAGGALDWAYMERVAESRGWLDGLAFLTLVYASVDASLFGTTLVPAAQRARFERILEPHAFARRRLEELRAQHAADLPLDLSYWFCKRLYYRKILADPARTARERWRDVGVTLLWGIKLKSGIRPQPGAIVSISGADGSGKTAHAEALVAALRLCELKATYFWNRGGSTGLVGLVNRLRRRLRPGAQTESADNLTRRRHHLANPLVRFAWAWLVAVDQILTYVLRVGLPARFGRVVVTDRYAYDTAVEMDAALPPDARWSRLAIATMLALTPRPRLGFLLSVSPETARARKPDEVWATDSETERERYRALATGRDLRSLSTEGNFAESNDRLIRDVMGTYMADFETWLNALFLGNPSQKNVPDAVWAREEAR